MTGHFWKRRQADWSGCRGRAPGWWALWSPAWRCRASAPPTAARETQPALRG